MPCWGGIVGREFHHYLCLLQEVESRSEERLLCDYSFIHSYPGGNQGTRMAEDRSRPKTDRERLQSVLDSMIDVKKDGSKSKPYQIDDNASALLMNYIEEAVLTILREGSQLSKHRDSNVVEIEDLQLILTKKYGLDVPGYAKSGATSMPHLTSIATKLTAFESRSLLSKSKARNDNDEDDVSSDGDNDDERSPTRKRIRK